MSSDVQGMFLWNIGLVGLLPISALGHVKCLTYDLFELN